MVLKAGNLEKQGFPVFWEAGKHEQIPLSVFGIPCFQREPDVPRVSNFFLNYSSSILRLERG